MTRFGSRGPMLVLLHWLGGSGRTWNEVAGILAERGVQCVALDLPGFGDAGDAAGYSKQAMCGAVLETLRALRGGDASEPWLIGGHSMGGSVAALVAREAANGADGLGGLRGAVLLSPSPPAPEPMKESKRQSMLDALGESTGDTAEDRKRAAKFVDDNTGRLALEDAVHERAIDDVLRMNRSAFRAWMQHGSKEDCSEFVGRLPIPALVLAGSEDSDLGEDTQRALTLPHYASGTLVTLQGGGHVLPLERAGEVAEYITEFATTLGLTLPATGAMIGEHFAALLESDRVSPQTRSVMQERMRTSADWNHIPTVLSAAEFRTMRALAGRVVPGVGFDVAGSIEHRLSEGNGDGWRFATLPPDIEAWKKGLRSLDAAAERGSNVNFIALHGAQQDELLQEPHDGKLGQGVLGSLHLGAGADAYNAGEMKQWFEDARAEFTECYMAHPSTMERIGFTGFADESGFTQIQFGEREEFEQ